MMLNPLYSDSDYFRIGGQPKYVGNEGEYRSFFWRDRARIMHSPSFRRLRGKTQLFPGNHSDFFRCRLTHSLEVGNIAKTIARRLNYNLLEKHGENQTQICIDTDLVELASYAHDIGHPPFGHQGEYVLNQLMKDFGGFEGNAQTLRILTVLEKKQYSLDQIKLDGKPDDYSGITSLGKDVRRGLNLTVRSLASVLKYDKILGKEEADSKGLPKNKGYYKTESTIVDLIKKKVSPELSGKLYTVECQIMDLADDIAYSTYDLEDAFKGGFLHPMLIHSMSDEFKELLVEKVNEALYKKNIKYKVTIQDIHDTLDELIYLPEKSYSKSVDKARFMLRSSLNYAEIGYLRTQFASKAISKFVSKIGITYNNENPALSLVTIDDRSIIQIEILKKISFLSQIESTKLKVVETRGQNIVEILYKMLDGTKNNKGELLPQDVKTVFLKIKDENYRKRVLCDFIASMTNRYASDYLDRLSSVNSIKSIWSIR